MQAIILAGGFGTRLQGVIYDVPKPMAPVCNKPFLEYILNHLNESGFSKVVIAVGYKKEVIINYFGTNYKNMKLIYSIEDKPLGTGGCIKQALKYIDEEYAYIINGDTYFKVDFNSMKTDKDIMIACKYLENFSRYGLVEILNDRIVSFQEKQPNKTGYINGGIYLIKKSIFSIFPLNEVFSLERDFFEKYVGDLYIESFCTTDYFIDIGIPEDYQKAQKDFPNE